MEISVTDGRHLLTAYCGTLFTFNERKADPVNLSEVTLNLSNGQRLRFSSHHNETHSKYHRHSVSGSGDKGCFALPSLPCLAFHIDFTT